MVKKKTTTIVSEKKKRDGSIIREVKLNNKSRKGTYIYIKPKVGDRGSYYKKKPGLVLKDYIEARAYGGVTRKKKGVTPRKTINKYLKALERQRKVEDIIKPGYSEYSINHAEKLTLFGEKTAYISLLTNKQKGFKNAPVGDKQLADILSRPENVEKWKHRIEYRITLLGDNMELAEIISPHRGKTLRNVKKDLKDANLKIGMDIADYSPTVKTNLKPLGYNYIHKNNGKLSQIRIKMIFRKG